ncbi:MAG TPA: hypothetical protein VEL76_40085 [Gemmataceae bacterium]|nr:hypothetical protein [Gemmataceae bacterium]
MTALVLLLAGLLGVLLLAHRADGTLLRAVVEYVIVAVLALLLAFTPATRGASAGMAAGVASGSARLGRLAAGAWQRATGQQAAGAPAAAEPTRPTPTAARPPRTTRPAAPTASTPAPAQASRPAARGGVPLPVGVLLLVAIVLLGLVGLAWRVRRLDRRDALAQGLARLPRGRGRRRRAA